MIHWNRLAALVWTVVWLPVTYFAAAFAMMGDCAEPAGQCLRNQRLLGWGIIAIGLVILIAVDWLLLRRRDR
ncbi:MAG: hypothetical protein ACJ8E3_02465 [Sphingomicrobium sp.]